MNSDEKPKVLKRKSQRRAKPHSWLSFDFKNQLHFTVVIALYINSNAFQNVLSVSFYYNLA
jgi:hypothetical protein